MSDSPVLLSWVAVNNDPYVPSRKVGAYLDESAPIPGPTLSFLFDEASPYKNQIKDVILLGNTNAPTREALAQTVSAIRQLDTQIRIKNFWWDGNDPTDHGAIFSFLKRKIYDIRKQYLERNLVINISPGTPAMQTIWVLMAETGLIPEPFTVVQGIPPHQRQGRPAVIPVKIGIETFYKAFSRTRPLQEQTSGESAIWDLAEIRSPRLEAVFNEARRFAHLKVPVMILGERGTGKTTLAGWLRAASPFRKAALDRSWPAVACGQYDQKTMRSELFGHVKGSFTGAEKDKEGLLKIANGDTLFLDEIGDINHDLQRLLIKALEEKRFLPLGATVPVDSDFRLVVATNLSPDTLSKRLDPDFHDRVSQLVLTMPPLREIPEELSWLWKKIYSKAARNAEISERQARLDSKSHQRVINALMRHPLPGNLRDLYRVAYWIMAGLNDMSTDEAVDYGLAALATEGRGKVSLGQRSKAVAECFVVGEPLDKVLRPGERLDYKALDRDMKHYLACELRRLCKERGVRPEYMCDLTERTLRNWVVPDVKE